MSVRPIRDPLFGERMVGLAPRPEVRLDPGAFARVRFVTGRSLAADTLAAETAGRAAAIARLAGTLTAGVIDGLEAELVAGDAPSLRIRAGRGLTARGQSVSLVRDHELAVDAVPVLAPAADLGGNGDVATGESVRRLGPPLAAVRAEGRPITPVGAIVLQPVAVETLADFDADDPCPIDDAARAFDDRVLVDGVRVVFAVWPEETVALPAAPPARRRNALANAVFRAELAAGRSAFPWWTDAVPLALLALDDDLRPLFLDRHAVRREVTATGRQALARSVARARIAQFADQQVERGGAAADAVGDFAQWLPPAAALPVDAFDRVTMAAPGLPASWQLAARVVPLEALETLVARSERLTPLDTTAVETVQLLLPVPAAVYDPALLDDQTIDPEFATTVDAFFDRLAVWLRRRHDVRAAAAALFAAIHGRAPNPADDPAALPDEAPADDPIRPEDEAFAAPEASYGTTAAGEDRTVDAVTSLRAALDAGTPLTEADLARLEDDGLDGFIDHLDRVLRRTDDKIDFGFLRAQTDIYRLRQLILGTEAASKLAISPAFATIAQGSTAAATTAQIEAFQRTLQAPTDADAPAPDSGSGGGTAAVVAGAVVASGAPTRTARFVSPTLALDTGAAPAPVDALGAFAPEFEVARESALFRATPPGRGFDFVEVQEANPIIGNLDVRTSTVGERLSQPAAATARDFSLRTKHDVLLGFTDAEINVDDIPLPWLGNAGATASTFADLVAGGDEVGFPAVLAGSFDAPGGDDAAADEAARLQTGVSALETIIGTLRSFEARAKDYRDARARAVQVRDDVRRSLRAADLRLKTIDDGIAEARHDVTTARALRAEELARLDAERARRAAVLDEHLAFVVALRPRTPLVDDALPERRLVPAAAAAAAPACLARPLEPAPAAISDAVELFRRMPSGWLARTAKALDVEGDLFELRARLLEPPPGSPAVVFGGSAFVEESAFAAAAGRRFAARAAAVDDAAATVQVERASIVAGSWLQVRGMAERKLVVADLWRGARGARVGALIAAELADIEKVAACLWGRFAAAPAFLRLLWAERLSAFDEGVSLRTLAALPRFDELDLVERREAQALVDWLYQRITPNIAQATAVVDDVVRICLLVAAHSPTAEIAAGRLQASAPAVVGGPLRLAVDAARVRIGMRALLLHADAVVGEAEVRDLADGEATARITAVHDAASTQFEVDTRVRLMRTAEGLGR